MIPDMRQDSTWVESVLFAIRHLLLAGIVALAGAAAGAFLVEWVRTLDNGSLLYQIGEGWLAGICKGIPWGSRINLLWHESPFHNLTAHFPGLLLGAAGALAGWLILAMQASWQNCLLFKTALRSLAWRFSPLHVCAVLALIEFQREDVVRQWIAFLPFALTFFLLAGAVRSIRLRALPAERTNPVGSQIDVRIPLFLLTLLCLHRFWEWWDIASMRHNHFYSQAYDMGLMTHVLVRFVTGEGLTSSLLVSGGSFLGHHFSPILLLLGPFCFFSPHADTLIAIQAGLIAFAALPLYRFARIYLHSNWAGFAVAWMYLFLPGLSEGVYSDFHAIAFAPILLFWLAAEALNGTGRRFYVALFLLLCVQENLFLYGFFLGLFFVVHKAHRRVGLWMSGLSLVAGLIIFLLLQPMLRPETDLGYGFVHRYQDLIPEAKASEAGMGDLVAGVLTQPGTVLSLLFDETRTRVYKLFWRGPLYLSLVNPAGWLILAPVLENSLSSEPYIHEWGGHYGIGPAALTALALTAGLGLLGRFLPMRRRFTPLAFTFLASTIFWGLKKTHLPYSIYLMSFYYLNPSEPPSTMRVLLEELPPGVSVSAQSYLVPHLVHQPRIHELPPGNPLFTDKIEDPNLPNFNILRPDVGWPEYIVFNPEAPEGNKWHNLWFYDKTRTLEWLGWLEESGKYHLFFPKPVRGEKESTLRILKRSEGVE